VPFIVFHAGKYRTEDKSKTDTTKTKHNPEKQNKTTLVQSPFTTLGQATRWPYSTMLPSPHKKRPLWNAMLPQMEQQHH